MENGFVGEGGRLAVRFRWSGGWPLFCSMALYWVSLALPALVLRIGRDSSDGTWIQGGPNESLFGASLLMSGLLFGWIRLNFTAFPNLPLWLSWFLFGRGRFGAARAGAVVALVISIETLQLLVQPYLFDEAGVKEGYLVAPHIGFFF